MKKKYNPATSSKTVLVTFRCPVVLHEKIKEVIENDINQSVTSVVVGALNSSFSKSSDKKS
ncbi:hypothetical protein TUM4438_44010 [Shewanella sairae]|uniref:CopG family transcriptional regulator n=1 Tax=Shewanella sairae TaxID=190310 RepID=A0ABQ4PRD8_9GAMM|nr:hypothetical protein TUM4438_44010 [Shewanella sairae]